jgi:hypothetical protein
VAGKCFPPEEDVNNFDCMTVAALRKAQADYDNLCDDFGRRGGEPGFLRFVFARSLIAYEGATSVVRDRATIGAGLVRDLKPDIEELLSCISAPAGASRSDLFLRRTLPALQIVKQKIAWLFGCIKSMRGDLEDRPTMGWRRYVFAALIPYMKWRKMFDDDRGCIDWLMNWEKSMGGVVSADMSWIDERLRAGGITTLGSMIYLKSRGKERDFPISRWWLNVRKREKARAKGNRNRILDNGAAYLVWKRGGYGGGIFSVGEVCLKDLEWNEGEAAFIQCASEVVADLCFTPAGRVRQAWRRPRL